MKVKHVPALLLAFVQLFMLPSCGLIDKLGFDTYDYMSEEIIGICPTDGETAEAIRELLDMLILDSPELPTFENMNESIREYRDAVLSHMLETGYAKYSGNTALMEQAEKMYPEYNITQIIPESEFEATMYRCFGGDVKLTHKDGDRFKYLEKVGAYISPVDPAVNDLHPLLLSIAETEKTFRVRFIIQSPEPSNGNLPKEYFALIIKREDGTLYIKKLMEGAVFFGVKRGQVLPEEELFMALRIRG